MDPYAAQWAHYGYAVGANAAPAAAYPAYYNYTGVQAPTPATGNGSFKQQRHQNNSGSGGNRHQTITQIATNSQPPASSTTWQNPNILPTSTYVPTKTFVKASGSGADSSGAGSAGASVYDPSNTVMKLHALAIHNNVVELYEKAETAIPGMHAVRLKLHEEVYAGVGTTFKLAKQDAATKALNETKLSKPAEKKTLKPRPVGITATQELHELATKKGLSPTFKFLEPYNFEFKPSMRLWSKEEMRGNYRVQLTVGTMEFMGHADLPQQAKHNAAVQALPYLHQMPNIKPPSKAATIPNAAGGDSKKATESAAMTKEGKNVIMVLNEIAMQQQVCIDWNILDEDGPPHMRAFTYTLKMGSYEAVGSGNSKKLAKAIAAQNMYQTIPDDWKDVNTNKMPKKAKPTKRKKPMPTPVPALSTAETSSESKLITSTNTTMENIEIPGEKRLKANGEGPNTLKPLALASPAPAGPTPIYSVIQTANPISALYEYCKKVKYPDPVFDCVSENVLETWQKNNHTFKKTEYTMKLEVAGKTYFGSANTKKAAKTAVATEAWNIIRSGTM